MARQTGIMSIYTISFLDVMGATFATILLVYVLLLVRLERIKERNTESRFAVLAVLVTAPDEQGRPDPQVALKARVEVLAPPAGRQRDSESPPQIPAGWGQFQLPYEEEAILDSCCSEVSAHANAEFVYCVLRGVRPGQCLFRLSFYATAGAERLRGIRLEGWLASPEGRQPLSAVVQKHLSTPVQADPTNPRVLELGRGGRAGDWLRAAVVLRAGMQPSEEAPRTGLRR